MKNNQKGFSLIELLVVIAILGILAAIAIPQYGKYKAQAYRSAGEAVLVEGTQNMERYFVRNNTYVGASVGDTAAGDEIQSSTEGGKYVLTFRDPTNTANAGNPTASDYVVRATPSFTEPDCGWLQIDEAGARTSQSCGNW